MLGNRFRLGFTARSRMTRGGLHALEVKQQIAKRRVARDAPTIVVAQF
jgi:hypothetical protein